MVLAERIKEYLSGRLHYVEVDGFPPSMLPVVSGAPQGEYFGATPIFAEHKCCTKYSFFYKSILFFLLLIAMGENR